MEHFGNNILFVEKKEDYGKGEEKKKNRAEHVVLNHKTTPANRNAKKKNFEWGGSRQLEREGGGKRSKEAKTRIKRQKTETYRRRSTAAEPKKDMARNRMEDVKQPKGNGEFQNEGKKKRHGKMKRPVARPGERPGKNCRGEEREKV